MFCMKTTTNKPARCKRASILGCWYEFEGGSHCSFRRASESYVRHSVWDCCREDFRAAHAIRVGATRCERSQSVELLHNRTDSTGKCRKSRRPKFWSNAHSDIDMLPNCPGVYEHFNSCEFFNCCAKYEGEVCHA